MFRLLKCAVLMVFLFGMALPFIVFADSESISLAGLDGEALTAFASTPQGDLLIVGTEQGLYVRAPQESAWRRMNDFPNEKISVRQIVMDVDRGACFAATQKGLFQFNDKEPKARNIFFRSNDLEMDATAIALDSDGSMYLGTKAGLFFLKDAGASWIKLSVPFGDQPVISLCVREGVVYAATSEGIFEGKNEGQSWNKIFNVYAQSGSDELSSSADISADTGEVCRDSIQQVAVSSGDKKSIAVVTSKGIFKTEDGASWSRYPLAGIDFVRLCFLIFDPASGQPFALTQTGVYALRRDQWDKIGDINEGRQITLVDKKIYIVAKHEVSTLSLDDRKKKGFRGITDPKKHIDEPTVQDVQRMAISYAELSDRKIKDWRRRASFKAFVPKVSLNIDKTVYGSSSGAFAVGPRDWGVGLSWDFSDFIYNDALTSIDVRAKLMVELRNDILAEATRLYFERKKLLMDMDSDRITDEKEKMSKELRLEEIVALIDRLTGGSYSKVLKSI